MRKGKRKTNLSKWSNLGTFMLLTGYIIAAMSSQPIILQSNKEIGLEISRD
jgi:hypothetical protein